MTMPDELHPDISLETAISALNSKVAECENLKVHVSILKDLLTEAKEEILVLKDRLCQCRVDPEL